MGAANALSAYNTWRGKLPPNAFTVLIYMCLVARDQDAAPSYFAGHDKLAAQGLGLEMPHGEGPGDERERENSLRAVRYAMSTLLKEGAVTTLRNAKPGKVAHYLLWLDGPAPVDKRTGRRRESLLRSSQNVGEEVSYVEPNVGENLPDRRRESLLQRSKEEELLQERSSSKPNLRNGETWKAPDLRVVEDPWAEDERRRNGHRRTSP